MHTRREFLVQVAGAVVTVHACGGGDGPSPEPPGEQPDAAPTPSASCLENGANTIISENHGHVLMVPSADVKTGTQRTYDIHGTATHSHLVTITAAMFAELARNQTFTVVSTSNDAHMHSLRLVCI